MRLVASRIVSAGLGPLVGLLAACSGASPDRAAPASASPAPTPPARAWSDFAPQLPDTGLVERFLAATEAMLGTPYENGPLGEGGGIDPDPRADFERVDCVTYLEQALALAVTLEGSEPFLRNLDVIRYADGRVSYEDRNHYMVTDWIPSNDWLLEDVTTSLAPTRTVERTIDRAAFLREHGGAPRADRDESLTRSLEVLPTAALPDAAPSIRDGDLIFWVGKAEGIFVVHTGLAVRDDAGTLLFRHGSSRAGKVMQEPLADYADAATFAIGLLVLRIREDARPPDGKSVEGVHG